MLCKGVRGSQPVVSVVGPGDSDTEPTDWESGVNSGPREFQSLLGRALASHRCPSFQVVASSRRCPIAKPAKGSRAFGVDSAHLHVPRLMMFETHWSASQTRYAAD
jgi:hypothetical protein